MTLKPIANIGERALPTPVIDQLEAAEAALRTGHKASNDVSVALQNVTLGLNEHNERNTLGRGAGRLSAELSDIARRMRGAHEDLAKLLLKVPERVS